MLPADQVEAFASLVDEVERMAAISEGTVRRRPKQEAGERSRRGAAGDGGEERALGGFAMAHGGPVPQPPPEGGKIGPARERRTLPARRLAVAVGRDAARTMEKGEIGLLLRERQQVAEGGQDG